MRRTFAQVLREGKIDLKNEYSKLYTLFYEVVHYNDYALADIISNHITEFYFHGTCLSLEEFDEMHGIQFEEYPDEFDIDYLINFCEYIFNFTIRLRDNLFSSKMTYIFHIQRVIEAVGYMQSEEDGFTIFVPKDNVAMEVSQSTLIPEKISYKVISYNHHSMKRNLEEKRQTLLVLADLLEPKRRELESVDRTLASDLFYALNNFDIRHNNVDPAGSKYKKPVAELSQEELEHWYDEVYQMCLLAFMRLDHAERKAEFDVLKGKIENKE